MENLKFDRWCFTAKDPQSPLFNGAPLPYLTTLLHRVCGDDQAKFEEATRILQAAFEAGQEAGQ